MDKAQPTMTQEQLQREANYRIALSVAARLRKEGVFMDADSRRIEQILRQKFSPVWGAITR